LVTAIEALMLNQSAETPMLIELDGKVKPRQLPGQEKVIVLPVTLKTRFVPTVGKFWAATSCTCPPLTTMVPVVNAAGQNHVHGNAARGSDGAGVPLDQMPVAMTEAGWLNCPLSWPSD